MSLKLVMRCVRSITGKLMPHCCHARRQLCAEGATVNVAHGFWKAVHCLDVPWLDEHRLAAIRPKPKARFHVIKPIRRPMDPFSSGLPASPRRRALPP